MWCGFRAAVLKLPPEARIGRGPAAVAVAVAAVAEAAGGLTTAATGLLAMLLLLLVLESSEKERMGDCWPGAAAAGYRMIMKGQSESL